MFRKLYNEELGRISIDEYKNSPKSPIVLILDNIRSMHNIGSAFRTSDAFKIGKIYLCGISAVPPAPEIHKSALGAEFSVDWEYCENTIDAVNKAKAEGYVIIGVEQTEDSTSLEQFAPVSGQKLALVFGNEVKGVQQEVIDVCDSTLEIPQFGTKHSLNVSVSIGVVLWHVVCHSLQN